MEEEKEPKSFKEASQKVECRKAMKEEIKALAEIKLGTWCQNLKM